MAGWLTDWLIELGFTLVMHWLTDILYDWLYLFEGWWCNTDLRAYKVYSLTGQCITSMKTFHQYELNTIKIGLHATTTRHTDQISWPFLPFWKTGPCWDRKVAFCRAVAVVERWPLVEVRLFITFGCWLCEILTDQLLIEWHIDLP